MLRVWTDEWRRLSPDCELVADEADPVAADDVDGIDREGMWAWDHARDRHERLGRLLGRVDPAWVDLTDRLALPDGTRAAALGDCVWMLDGATGRVLRRSCTAQEEDSPA